jgi:hypothetical protein
MGPCGARRSGSGARGLRAPHVVFGCLGNHETITQTEDSITGLFAAQDIHILRQERAPIRLGSDTLNLIGIDDSQPDLKVIARQVMPDTVNILLVHDQAPNGFNQAVELWTVIARVSAPIRLERLLRQLDQEPAARRDGSFRAPRARRCRNASHHDQSHGLGSCVASARG